MQVKSIAECSKGSNLQYLWPSFSYHLSLRSLFCLFYEWPFYTNFTVVASQTKYLTSMDSFFRSLKGVYTCQNTTLLAITCHSSNVFSLGIQVVPHTPQMLSSMPGKQLSKHRMACETIRQGLLLLLLTVCRQIFDIE